MKTKIETKKVSISKIDVSQGYVRLVYGKNEFWIGKSLYDTVRKAMSMSERMKKHGDESLKVVKVV